MRPVDGLKRQEAAELRAQLDQLDERAAKLAELLRRLLASRPAAA